MCGAAHSSRRSSAATVGARKNNERNARDGDRFACHEPAGQWQLERARRAKRRGRSRRQAVANDLASPAPGGQIAPRGGHPSSIRSLANHDLAVLHHVHAARGAPRRRAPLAHLTLAWPPHTSLCLHGRPTSCLHGRPAAAQDFPLVRAPRLPQALVASPIRQGRWEALRRVVDPRRPCLPAAWSMVCQGSRRSRCCSRGTLSVPQPRCADSLLLTQRALPCSASAARSTRGQRFKKSSTHCARVSQSSARRPCRQTACARELPTPQSMSRCRPRYAPSISAQASRGRRGGTSSASRHLRAT